MAAVVAAAFDALTLGFDHELNADDIAHPLGCPGNEIKTELDALVAQGHIACVHKSTPGDEHGHGVSTYWPRRHGVFECLRR